MADDELIPYKEDAPLLRPTPTPARAAWKSDEGADGAARTTTTTGWAAAAASEQFWASSSASVSASEVAVHNPAAAADGAQHAETEARQSAVSLATIASMMGDTVTPLLPPGLTAPGNYGATDVCAAPTPPPFGHPSGNVHVNYGMLINSGAATSARGVDGPPARSSSSRDAALRQPAMLPYPRSFEDQVERYHYSTTRMWALALIHMLLWFPVGLVFAFIRPEIGRGNVYKVLACLFLGLAVVSMLIISYVIGFYYGMMVIVHACFALAMVAASVEVEQIELGLRMKDDLRFQRDVLCIKAR